MNHREASALIPWLVNGTLREAERQKVDAHVRACALCREDLALETSIYQGMAADSGIEYIPAASLKKLQSKVDELEAGGAPATSAGSERPRRIRHSNVWRIAWAASIAAAVGAIGVLSFERMQAPVFAPASYHTVTNAEPRSPREVIRAVFSPTITLVEMQAILDEAQLGIISGPTEAGVYSLAAKSNRPVSASLALLRRHATVRFAESTRPDAPVGVSP